MASFVTYLGGASSFCFSEVGRTETLRRQKGASSCRRLLVEALISRTRLEFKHSIKTDGPLMCAGVLIEWRGVVQGCVIANFRSDQQPGKRLGQRRFNRHAPSDFEV